jgi:serine/threonine protein kinase/WD40 repeat protein
VASDPKRVQAVFLQAVELPSANRASVLSCECGDDRELRQRVEALLQAHDEPDSFLEKPARDAGATEDEQLVEWEDGPGTIIGPYKLLEQIGEGGFGVVYMAEQQHPVRRKVALKVLKPGMDTRQVVARFEAERQALALMDHPYIAHVLDAGTTDWGRPYFVMELIRGIPITQFCDDNRLTPRERLELFVTVCQAVQHAHQKGIIHRDLKPSNVLVTLLDGTPTVKVIDFGIAKALGQERLTDKTLFTGLAHMIGTPLYMSPEQAEINGRDVDTRTDIYALGVPLYELLTGTTPFDKERLKEASYDEIRRIIREEEPIKPSTRINTLGQVATTVSANRKSEPRCLSQLFRGELDWIVMKALEKDRNRRYESASAFAGDVQRYLHDEPVLACPPSLLYRLRKFARRNKRVVVLSAAAILLLSAATVVSSYFAIQADKRAREAIRQKERGETNLYHSLVGEARALRLARVVGYRQQAWDRIRKAMELDTPVKDNEKLRQEAVACMGDFVGLEPIIWKQFPAKISAVALDPQGEQVVIGLKDGRVLLRQVSTGAEAQLQAHDSQVDALAFGPGGNMFVSAQSNGTIKVWEPDVSGAWRCARILSIAPSDDVLNATWLRSIWLAITPDGKHLAACSKGTSVVSMFSLAGGSRIADYTEAGILLCGLALSADSHLLAAGYKSKDTDLRVVSATTAGLVGASLGQGPLLAASALIPGIRKAEHGILVWDLDSREIKQRLAVPTAIGVAGVAFSPDGRFLACAYHGGVALYETTGFQRHLLRQGDIVHSVAISLHRQFVALSSEFGIVRVLDPLMNREVAVLLHPDTPHSVVFSRSGRILVSADERSVRIWQLPGTKEKLVLPGRANGLAFSPDGGLLASVGGDQNHSVIIWNPATGQFIKELRPFRAYAEAVAFSPDGRMLAAGDFAGAIRIWQVGSWKELASFERGASQVEASQRIWEVAFSPNGRYFAAASGRGGLAIWSVQEADRGARPTLQEISGPRGQNVTSFCFSPAGTRLAWVSAGPQEFGGHTVHLWDLQKSKALPGPTSYLANFRHALAFSPDGAHLTFINDQEEVEVWNVDRNQQAYCFGHEDIKQGSWEVALSADGAWLALGCSPTVTIWDTATRKLLLALPDEHSLIPSMAWGPERELLAVATCGGEIGIWNIPIIRAELAELGLDWQRAPGFLR